MLFLHRGFGVKRTPTKVGVGYQVDDLESWVKLLVLQAEKQLNQKLSHVDLKFSIDARVQFDKGQKATEGVIELLNAPGLGMDGCASVVKWEGSDGAEEIRAPIQGLDFSTLEDETTNTFIPSIGTQLQALVQEGVTIYSEDKQEKRVLQVNYFECHDMVSALAVVDSNLSVLGNDFDFLCDEVTKSKEPAPNKRSIGDTLEMYTVAENDTLVKIAMKHFMTVELLQVCIFERLF